MKKILTTLLLFIAMSAMNLSAQEYNFKYGKVTNDEVNMTSYQKDTTASAVTIYKNTDVDYNYGANGFDIGYRHETKIKILKSEGTEYANVNIPFYNNGKSGSSKEIVSGIEAYAYNIENGKVIKTKMNKSYIFEEKINENYKQIKFTIPSVKAGTVIEYKYNLISEFYYSLSDMVIQQSIPVIHGKYEVRIPEYFKFSIETRSTEPIKTEEGSSNQSFTVKDDGGHFQNVTCSCRQLTFTVNDLPALKDEPNVWCPDDFRSQVSFELKGTQYPNSIYKPFTSSWNEIDELLKKEDSFGGALKIKNPFKEEMHTIKLSNLSVQDKIRTIYKYLKTKVSWNDKYSLTETDIKKSIKNGTGTNADINFILISMLKDAGIEAFPVMMSRRDQGRLPYAYPSLNKLTTFIVGINDTDSTTVYLDGSVKNGDINILPPALMVDRARTFNPKGAGGWVDLTNVGRHSINALISGTITPEGVITGERNVSYIGEQAAGFRAAFKAAKDSTAFIEKTESEDGISIKECAFKDLNSFSSSVQEKLSFTKEATSNDDHIYLNPMIFPHLTKNQFTKEERKFPVEFDYPYTFKLTSILTIPDGYQVEEMPKPIKINMNNEGCTCIYNIKCENNQLLVRYLFYLNRILYTKDEYSALRQLWGTIIDKNNEQIVLKKVTQQPASTNQKQITQL